MIRRLVCQHGGRHLKPQDLVTDLRGRLGASVCRRCEYLSISLEIDKLSLLLLLLDGSGDMRELVYQSCTVCVWEKVRGKWVSLFVCPCVCVL